MWHAERRRRLAALLILLPAAGCTRWVVAYDPTGLPPVARLDPGESAVRVADESEIAVLERAGGGFRLRGEPEREHHESWLEEESVDLEIPLEIQAGEAPFHLVDCALPQALPPEAPQALVALGTTPPTVRLSIPEGEERVVPAGERRVVKVHLTKERLGTGFDPGAPPSGVEPEAALEGPRACAAAEPWRDALAAWRFSLARFEPAALGGVAAMGLVFFAVLLH